MSTLSKDWTVARALQAYPQLRTAFLRLKTDCLGCQMERFCSLEDVAREYHLDLDAFLNELMLDLESNSPQV